MTAKKSKYITQAKFAEILGVSQPCVSVYIRKGKLAGAIKHRGHRTLIDLDKALAILPGNMSNINRKQPTWKPKKELSAEEKEKTAEKAGIAGVDYNTAHTLHEQYRAALRKLEYEEKRGQLISADQVRRDADSAARLVKDKVTTWPSRIAPLIAAESDLFKCEQILKQECDQLLEEISQEVLK